LFFNQKLSTLHLFQSNICLYPREWCVW